MRAATIPSALLVALAGWSGLAASASAQQEVVTGFHGYPWGTRLDQIPEVAGTPQVGQRDGLAIHSAQVTFQGRRALAGFYFHPDTGELMEGQYVIALTLQDCEWAWANVSRAVKNEYPTLELHEQIPTRAGRDLQVYESDCEYFAFNSHREHWLTELKNAEPPGDLVGIWMKTVERVPRLTVYYKGAAAQAWAAAKRSGR